MVCNSVKVNSTQQPPSGNYIGFYYKYQITLASSVTTSWTNLNSLSLFFSYTGVYMITARFTIDYLTNNMSQALYYALSTSSTGLDTNATVDMYYVSQGVSAYVKTTINVHRTIYISSTSTSVYLIGFSALSSPVFNISNETTSSISYIRIA